MNGEAAPEGRPDFTYVQCAACTGRCNGFCPALVAVDRAVRRRREAARRDFSYWSLVPRDIRERTA